MALGVSQSLGSTIYFAPPFILKTLLTNVSSVRPSVVRSAASRRENGYSVLAIHFEHRKPSLYKTESQNKKAVNQ